MLTERRGAGEADVVWFTALWPETYSYTLSAAIEAGLPIVAPNIGAFAERLYGRKNSWVVPWDNSAAQMAEFFGTLSKHGSEAEVLANLHSHKHPAKLFTNYQDSYLSLLDATSTETQALNDTDLQNWLALSQPLTKADLSFKQKLRRKALYGLFKVRQAPLLRSVAKRVPLSLQRRVRDKLMR